MVLALLVTAAAACAQPAADYEPTEQDLAAEAAGRFADYRARGEAALARGELRDALAAFDQALTAHGDPELARTASELREKVTAHDDALAEARDLARDPDTLEEAIETCLRARGAWASAEVREALSAARKELARLKAAEREAPPPPPPSLPAPPAPPEGYPRDTFIPVPYGPPPVQLVPIVPAPFDPVGADPFGLQFNASAPLNHRIAGLLVEAADELTAEGALADAVRALERALVLLPQAPLVVTRLAEARRRLAASGGAVRSGGAPKLALLPFDVRGAPIALSMELPARIGQLLDRDYRVIDPGQVAGWTARLGLGFGDLASDPTVRRELGSALDVRLYLFGTVRSDREGLVATSSLMDAATGQRRRVREVRAKSTADLLKRASELAR